MTQSVPKYIGEEIELGHHLIDSQSDDPALDAGLALIAAHHELYGHGRGDSDPSLAEYDADSHRVYFDHSHAEGDSSLVASASDLVLDQRKLRAKIIRCREAAEKKVGPIRVYYDNSNRLGVSWGDHANITINRETFMRWVDNEWRPLMHQWVPFICSSPLLFGAGKTGAEKGAAPCAFQLSQRIDFLDRVVGFETVTSKSLVNTRDESHARYDQLARFHIISFDLVSLDFSRWLKFGCIQLVLALLEEGYPLPDFTLADPLNAMATASRDLTMKRPILLADGPSITPLEVQRSLAECVSKAILDGSAASAVPDAHHIVTHWMQTLDDLEHDTPRLARRLDWRARLEVLRRAQAMPGATIETLKLADLNFGELDGALDVLKEMGAVDRLEDFLPDRSVGASYLIPREEARGLLLRRFHTHLVEVNWDYVVARDLQGRPWEIHLDEPFDSRDLLNTVKRAQDWALCLNELAKQGSATRLEPPAIVLVVETQTQEDESNEELATEN